MPSRHRRRRVRGLIRLGAVLAALGCFTSSAATAGQDFSRWLADLRLEARGQGISQVTLDRALGSVKPIARVIELDRRQPEFTQTFWSYLDRAVSAKRVETGRRLLAKHAVLLQDVERRYGVQPRFLVAIWGLESDYGQVTGGFPVIGALATLAHDKRRSAFFRAELLQSLRIIDQGHITAARMTGSWAGAMGQVQFMPSTFTGYAVDGDGDGRRDIWHSLPDAFASAANFLRALSWHGDMTWGREVRLPGDFNWEWNGLDQVKTLADWQALGVRRAGGGNLPRVEVSGSIVLPAGHAGPAFLVYQNYRSTLGWNRSHLFAIAVGHLADRIAGGGPFLSTRPAEDRPLSRTEMKEIQSRLAALGFDPGPIDGVMGSGSRAALRAYQRSAKQPPDGYPTARLLDELRQVRQP